jgi:phage recombination protein Bet
MSNLAVAKQQASVPALSMNETELIDVLQSSVYPGAKIESIKLVIGACRASGKDPLKKPYHIVPMQISTGKKNEKGWDIKEWRDVIMPGINDYRTDASRTGQHAGTSEPEFGPDKNEVLNGVSITYPEWCRVTVKRLMPSGQIVEFSAVERWKENYATAGRDNDSPNAMWKRRPYAQLAKCFDENTEVLTTHGFQRFDSVSGRVLQVGKNGLEPCDASPFVLDYNGEMIVADGTRLNFVVTPNHDMITTAGKIEAGDLFDQATKSGDKFLIPRAPSSTRCDAPIPDTVLRLAGYFLADGSHTGYRQMRIAVSRTWKVEALREIALHQSESVKRDAGRVSQASGRDIVTTADKTQFVYSFDLLEQIVSADKSINCDAVLQLSSRQAKVMADALIAFDGSDNGSGVRRLSQKNSNVLRGFEVLAVHAGYSISARAERTSDIGSSHSITVSEADHFPIIRGVEKNSASLVKRINVTGKVWCVTVPSGVIVVRRNGFSMLCGNCAEAQALRKGFPEVGSQPIADEMEGKEIDMGSAEVVSHTPTRTEPAELPPYPAADFEKNLDLWKSAIAAEKATPNQIIARSSTKYTLTGEQITAIQNLAKPAHIDNDGVIDGDFVRDFEQGSAA